MRKKILVTGSEGFIGSHLVEMLVRKNYKVRAFVQYNSFNSIDLSFPKSSLVLIQEIPILGNWFIFVSFF